MSRAYGSAPGRPFVASAEDMERRLRFWTTFRVRTVEPGIASAQIRALETLCERHSSDKTDVGPGHPRNRNREFQLSLASPPIGRGEGDPVRLACTRCSSQETQTRRHQGRVQPHNPASGGFVRIQRKAGGDKLEVLVFTLSRSSSAASNARRGRERGV